MPMFVGGAIAGSAVIGYMGQQDAMNSAKGTAREQMAMTERYNKLRDPFSMGGHREQYVGKLNAMAQGGPSSMLNDPMFQWLQNQGEQKVQRQHSALGDVQSTAETRDLASMGFGQANDYWKQQMDIYSKLSGADQSNVQAPQGMSPGDMYNMSMGQTASTAGLWQAGMSTLQGIYGKGGTGTGTPSVTPSSPGLSNGGWGGTSLSSMYRGGVQ